jgi:steroid 5-alpha reductase family enzyme
MHEVQALWEWTVLLPVTAAQAFTPPQDMGPWGFIGFVLYMLLFLFETGGANALLQILVQT